MMIAGGQLAPGHGGCSPDRVTPSAHPETPPTMGSFAANKVESMKGHNLLSVGPIVGYLVRSRWHLAAGCVSPVLGNTGVCGRDPGRGRVCGVSGGGSGGSSGGAVGFGAYVCAQESVRCGGCRSIPRERRVAVPGELRHERLMAMALQYCP